MSTINWAQLVKDVGDIKPPTLGQHLVTIIKAEPKVASTGNHYWKATMQIQGPGPDAGKTVSNNFTLSQSSPKAVEYFFKTMLVLGITQDQIIATNGDDQQLANMLVGKQASITLKASTNPQYPDPDVEFVNAHPAGPVAQGGIGAPTGLGQAPVAIPQAQTIPQAQAAPQAPVQAPEAPQVPQQAVQMPQAVAQEVWAAPGTPQEATIAPQAPQAPQAMPAAPQAVPSVPQAMPAVPQAMPTAPAAQVVPEQQPMALAPEQPQAAPAAPAIPAMPVPPTPSF